MATFEIEVVKTKMLQAKLKVEAATPMGAERQALAHLTKTPSEWRDWHEEEPTITWIRKLNPEK